MLFLKRNIYPNEIYKCDVSGTLIEFLDYYYEDDEDGLIVRADTYHLMKRRERRRNFDFSRLNEITDRIEYEEALKEYEQLALTDDIMEREVYKG